MSTTQNDQLYQALSQLNILDPKQLTEIYETSKTNNHSLSELLLQKDLISDENLGKIVADLEGVPLINLASQDIPEEVLHLIPEIVAKHQLVISFKQDPSGVHLAMANPADQKMLNYLSKKTGQNILRYYATKRDILEAISRYNQDITQTFDIIMAESIKAAKGTAESDPPIVKIVDTLLDYADRNHASDIHIEPLEEKSLVRFRTDGLLHDVVTLPKEIHDKLVTRIKVMASLRTDEHQASQDGKLEVHDLDVRVSIVPITNGEKVVLRLLSERARGFSLEDLGFGEDDIKKVESARSKPHGMILATGPTGSGKTTTLYALLKKINNRSVNIMTIEDPVEYDMEGVNQIQVNNKTNLTFAAGLRSIVRQDPDVILVGEIRDEETAGIAINSAMTGHLVLSTLHTNDAATAIPRLFDMGIEPFLVASTVNIIIAQRLVRKIHPGCRASLEITPADLHGLASATLIQHFFGKAKKLRVYKGGGCKLDHDTGYEGRVGIYEVMVINDELRSAIMAKKDAAQIRELAIKNGMRTMLEDGLDKVKQGITTIEEVLRVTKE